MVSKNVPPGGIVGAAIVVCGEGVEVHELWCRENGSVGGAACVDETGVELRGLGWLECHSDGRAVEDNLAASVDRRYKVIMKCPMCLWVDDALFYYMVLDCGRTSVVQERRCSQSIRRVSYRRTCRLSQNDVILVVRRPISIWQLHTIAPALSEQTISNISRVRAVAVCKHIENSPRSGPNLSAPGFAKGKHAYRHVICLIPCSDGANPYVTCNP